MAKLRIILAETEEKVLQALEFKLLYELRDNAELEVISNADYFREFFSTQQRADILICGQMMFSHDLRRHDINKIFMLSEGGPSDTESEAGVEQVNKYSNPNIIIDQILKGTNLRQNNSEPITVLIYSANGGTGKTTVALGICAAMAKDYKRVLYINAERINTFQNRLHGSANIPNSMIKELMHPGEDIYQRIKHIIRKDGFDYLPPFSVAISSMGLSFSMYEKIALSAKNSRDYDVIVIDTDSVFDENKASLITKSDRVFVVLNQTKTSVFATNALLSNMNSADSSKFFFICNAYDSKKENAILSKDTVPRFTVSENIAYIEDVENMELGQLAMHNDMQKTAYLMI